MKVCKECSKEFEPAPQKGSEQIYCSRKCATKSANKRRIEKLVNSAIQQQQPKQKELNPLGRTARPIQQHPGYAEDLDGTQGRVDAVGHHGGFASNNPGKDYLELYYEAKIDFNRIELANENLQRRVQELEKEVFDLNGELDELDREKGEGMLGSIVEQFKKDPINSVKFASALFENLTTTKQKQ